MPKYNNTDIYTYDAVLDARDFLLGSDWNNAKKSKNYKLEHLRYFILQGLDASNNGFLVNNGYTLEDNILTINAGWQWMLNGMLFTNAENIVFELEYTQEGFVRTDSVYANANNQFAIVTGEETETIAIQPAIPVNTLLAFTINIFDDSVGEPVEPILGSIYQKKQYDGVQVFNSSGSDLVVPLNFQGYSNIFLEGTINSIVGFSFDLLNENPTLAEFPHEGKLYWFFNNTDHEILLKHNVPDGDMFFTFKDEQDIVIPVNGILLLKNSSGGLIDVLKSWSNFVDIIGLQDELDLKLDIADYNDRFKGKYTSLINLQAAHPTANDGDYAIVDSGSGTDALEYIWDANEGWVKGNSTGASTTDALAEGSLNLYFTAARVLATVLSGLSSSSGTFNSSDSLITALGKVKYLIDNIASAYQAILVSGTNIKTVGGSSLLGSGDVPVDVQVYKTISSNTTLDNTYHNSIVWVTATSNITIPSGLRSDFACTFRTLTGVIASFLTSGTTINSESDGDVMAEKSMCFLATYSSNNFIISGGGLS